MDSQSTATTARRRRRRRHPWGASPSVGTLVSAVIIAYGTYRFAKWVWNTHRDEEEEEEDKNEQEEEETMQPSVVEPRTEPRATSTDAAEAQKEEAKISPLKHTKIESEEESIPADTSAPQISENRSTEQAQSHESVPTAATATAADTAKPQVNENHHSSPKSNGTSTTATATSSVTQGTKINPILNRKKIRRQRMARCREETIKALDGFLPTLRSTIEAKTNTSKETQTLKKIRSERGNEVMELIRLKDEDHLWETIKVRTITRMMATAYAHTILFLVLTVQVNLLGGKLFQEQMMLSSLDNGGERGGDTASDRLASYQASHRLVLTRTYEYFFDRGLLLLIDTVERAVSEVVRYWVLSDRSTLNMTQEVFEDGIQKIRSIVESGHEPFEEEDGNGYPRGVVRFLMPLSAGDSDLGDTINGDKLARSILDETWDLLESPVVADAQRDCLKMTFDMMRDQYWGKAFEATGTMPLVSILPKLKKAANSFYVKSDEKDLDAKVPTSCYCAAMQTLPSVLELGDTSFN